MQRAKWYSPLVLVLWLALLQWVQPSPIVPVSLRNTERMGALGGTRTFLDAPQAIKADGRTSLSPTGDTRMVRVSTPPANALLRATRVAGVTALVRDSAPTSSGTHSHGPIWQALHGPGLPTSMAQCALARRDRTSHRCAAHGGTLPYFPTAPPFSA